MCSVRYVVLGFLYVIFSGVNYDIYIYIYPPGADVRSKFDWGFNCVVICSGYVSECLRVCLGLRVDLDFL